MDFDYYENLRDYYTIKNKYINIDIFVEEIIILIFIGILIMVMFSLAFLKYLVKNYFIKKENEILIGLLKKPPNNKKAFFIKQIFFNRNYKSLKKNKIKNKEYKNNNFFKENSNEMNDKSNINNLYNCEICNEQIFY